MSCKALSHCHEWLHYVGDTWWFRFNKWVSHVTVLGIVVHSIISASVTVCSPRCLIGSRYPANRKNETYSLATVHRAPWLPGRRDDVPCRGRTTHAWEGAPFLLRNIWAFVTVLFLGLFSLTETGPRMRSTVLETWTISIVRKRVTCSTVVHRRDPTPSCARKSPLQGT